MFRKVEEKDKDGVYYSFKMCSWLRVDKNFCNKDLWKS